MAKRRHKARRSKGLRGGNSYVCGKVRKVPRSKLTLGKNCKRVHPVDRGERASKSHRFVQVDGYRIATR